MAPGTMVGLLGTAHLVELEVSIACSKKSDSLTRLNVAWLPDAGKTAGLYLWWWWVGRHLFQEKNKQTKQTKARFAMAMSATAPDLVFWIWWGCDRWVQSTIVGMYHDRWQKPQNEQSWLGRACLFLCPTCAENNKFSISTSDKLLPSVKTAVVVRHPR